MSLGNCKWWLKIKESEEEKRIICLCKRNHKKYVSRLVTQTSYNNCTTIDNRTTRPAQIYWWKEEELDKHNFLGKRHEDIQAWSCIYHIFIYHGMDYDVHLRTLYPYCMICICELCNLSLVKRINNILDPRCLSQFCHFVVSWRNVMSSQPYSLRVSLSLKAL